MSDEIAQKVGRGGAGNYYTKADVENALHASLPLQKSSVRVDTQPESPAYSRTGRGGVGNYIAPSQELPTSSDAKDNFDPAIESLDASKEKLRDKITINKGAVYRGHSGRGGAGNWKQGGDEAERKRAEDKEIKVRSKIDESIRLDVEKGLTLPPKAYAAPENAFRRK